MAVDHAGNVQPQLDLEEHEGSLNAKRVTLVGSAGQATVTPQGLVTLAPSPNYIGLATTINAAGDRFIGLVTNVQAGLTTLAPSPNFVGIVTVGNTVNANVSLNNSISNIGFATVRIGTNVNTNIGLVTVDGGRIGILGNVTLSNPNTYIGLTTTTLGVGDRFIGLVTVGNTINANVSLGASAQFIGLTTTTLGASPAFVGIVTIANSNVRSIAGNVTLDDGSLTGLVDGVDPVMKASIASVADGTYLAVGMRGNSTIIVGNTPNVSVLGNVTLSDSKGFIGLVTATGNVGISSAATIFAVVNTGGSAANVTLNPSPNFIGIVTVANPSSFAGNVTLDDGSLTGIVDGADPVMKASVASVADGTYLAVRMRGNSTIIVGNTPNVGVVGNVTLSDAKTFIGLTTTTLGASPAFIGIATTINAASPAFIGIVTIANSNARSIVGNLTLSDAKTFIGLVTSVNGAGDRFIGLVTTIYAPPPISTYTSFATVFSASGNASLFAPPAGKRFVIKDLHVSSLGRAEVRFTSNSNELIPYTSLSTTSGFFEHYGESGLAAQAADEIFALNLNGAATISVMVNVRFE